MKYVFEKSDLWGSNGLASVPGPTNKIHVCLSGGGFRAAFFHLGALLALAEDRKLERVSMLATVSGGSIAAAFLLSELVKLSDEKILLESQDFVSCCENSFKNLSNKISGNPRARAFSSCQALSRILVHNEFGFSKAMARIYRNWLPKCIKKLETQTFALLPEWRICTSDYSNGKRTVIILNPKIKITSKDAEYLHIKDIGIFNSIAASAAVPFVFEPVRTQNCQLGDGGILDNQGVRELSDESVESLCIDASAELRVTDSWISGIRTFGRSVDLMMEQLRADAIRKWHGTTLGLRNCNDSVAAQSWFGAIKLLRTDLDDFTSVEADLLFLAGYQSIKGSCTAPANELFSDTRSIYDLVLAPPEKRGPVGVILYQKILQKLADGQHTLGAEFKRFSFENMFAIAMRAYAVVAAFLLIGGYTLGFLLRMDSFLPNWLLNLNEWWVYSAVSVLGACYLAGYHRETSSLTSKKRYFLTFGRIGLLSPFFIFLVFSSRFIWLLPLLHSSRRFFNFGLRSKIKKWSLNL